MGDTEEPLTHTKSFAVTRYFHSFFTNIFIYACLFLLAKMPEKTKFYEMPSGEGKRNWKDWIYKCRWLCPADLLTVRSWNPVRSCRRSTQIHKSCNGIEKINISWKTQVAIIIFLGYSFLGNQEFYIHNWNVIFCFNLDVLSGNVI